MVLGGTVALAGIFGGCKTAPPPPVTILKAELPPIPEYNGTHYDNRLVPERDRPVPRDEVTPPRPLPSEVVEEVETNPSFSESFEPAKGGSKPAKGSGSPLANGDVDEQHSRGVAAGL